MQRNLWQKFDLEIEDSANQTERQLPDFSKLQFPSTMIDFGFGSSTKDWREGRRDFGSSDGGIPLEIPVGQITTDHMPGDNNPGEGTRMRILSRGTPQGGTQVDRC